MKKWFVTMFMILTAVCCAPAVAPKLPTDTSACPLACKQMRKLSCVQANPIKMTLGQYQAFTQDELEVLDSSSFPCTPADATLVCIPCESFCSYEQTHGHSLNPTCLSTIVSCGEVSSKCHD